MRDTWIEKFADGNWHPLPLLVRESGITDKHVRRMLDTFVRGLPFKATRKQVGPELHYRIFPIRKKDKAVSSVELSAHLLPLVDDLNTLANKGMDAIPPVLVREVAHKLTKLLKEWS